MASILASAVTGSLPSIAKFFSEENKVDVAEVNQWFCLEERGQWIENGNRTHLVLASGKLVQKKQVGRWWIDPQNSRIITSNEAGSFDRGQLAREAMASQTYTNWAHLKKSSLSNLAKNGEAQQTSVTVVLTQNSLPLQHIRGCF